jgi:hypothetical protein
MQRKRKKDFKAAQRQHNWRVKQIEKGRRKIGMYVSRHLSFFLKGRPSQLVEFFTAHGVPVKFTKYFKGVNHE